MHYLDSDPPTYAESIADMITGFKRVQAKTVTRPVMVRIPLNELMNIDALAEVAGGLSRNQMVILLLNAGMEAVLPHLDDAGKERYFGAVSRLASSYTQDPANEEQEG